MPVSTFRDASSSRCAAELVLGERGLESEPALEPHLLGDVAEELVDRRDADRLEHLGAIGLGERELAQESSRTCLYAATSSKESTSPGSDSLTRSNQPSP